jgi:integrase
VFPTLAAAKAWRADGVSALNKGRRVAQTRKTLREAADAWLAGAKADPPTVLNRSGRPFKPSVIRTYESDLERFVLPDLGALRLSDVSRGELKALVDHLVGKGLFPSRVRGIVNPVRAIFRDAIEAEEVQLNPTIGLRLPAAPAPRRRAAEPTDIEHVSRRAPQGGSAAVRNGLSGRPPPR